MQRKTVLFLFFLTGISALIYEIAWVRQATLTFGVSIYAYSAVLTAYMGGMALGSFLVGRRADRSAQPLRLFAALQVTLAVLGGLTPLLLAGMTALYSSAARALNPGLGALTALRLALALVALVPPSIFIGALFPVMGRLLARAEGRVGADLGWMYAVNTLGSVLGCLLTAVVLIRAIGTQGSVLLAGAINLLAALGAVLLPQVQAPTARAAARRAATPARGKRHAGREPAAIDPAPAQTTGKAEAPVSAQRQRTFILWAYALSGFAALAYEIIWARIIGLYTVGAVYSFSIMLTVFLSGLALGGLAAAAWMRRHRATLALFGALELGIGLLAVLAMFAFAQLPRLSIEDVFGSYTVSNEIAYEGVLSFLTLFPVTLLIGAVFPVATSLYTAEQSGEVGGRVARLSALNTSGSILGSLLGGFAILPLLGIHGSVLLLAGANLLIGAAALLLFAPRAQAARRMQWGGAGAVVVVAAAAALLLPNARYLGYWQSKAGQLIFYKEGIEATVAVFDQSADNPKFSTVNGRIEVPTDALSMRAFYLLGHLPPLLNPTAKNALMLSFGNGIASGALVSHGVPSLEVVELAPEQVEAARTVYTAENRGVTGYPGLKIHIEDARNFLLQTDRKFDIITTDATHPSNASSWALFTREFYQGIRDHLAPGGVFLQWVPIHNLSIADYKTILRTYQSVFPTATLWYGGGSHTLILATPQPLTRAELLAKLSAETLNPAVKADLGGPDGIARHFIMTSDQLSAFAGPGRIAADDSAFFLPDNSQMEELTSLIQTAAVQANTPAK